MKKYLIGIVVIAFALRVYHLNYNTAFLDEAQYITVGLRILGGDIASGIGGSSWVGGFPFLFPLASAVFYSIGGLIGSRLFTVILGTICVLLLYQFTKQLMFFKEKRMNEKAGLLAAAFLAITTVALTTSRLAIYDGLAFTLFFLGVVVFHRALYSGEKKFYLSSAVILFLAFLSKYIVAIYFPFLLLVPILVALKLKLVGWMRGIILYFCLPLILLTALYAGLNFNNLREFFVNQGVVEKASESEVVSLYWQYTGIAFAMGLVGMKALWSRDKFLVVLLFFFSFIPLIVHSLTGNTASVQQHTFLSLIFLLPIMGAGFIALLQQYKRLALLVIIATFGLQIILTRGQLQEAESFWPNVTEASAVIKNNIEPSDRVLAESGDSVYLELKNNIAYDNLAGPFVFYYAEKEGLPAYVDAIDNGYFQFVQLDGTFFSEEDIQAIEKALQTNYRKTYDNGALKVYELNNSSAL